MAERPISPHVFHYKWGYTMSLSILHRFTGVALSVSLIGLVAWLASASLGPAAYNHALPLLTSLPFRVLVALASVALIYHFCNGLRHLAWDIGWGYERAAARRSAALVVIATVLVAAVCVFCLLRHAGAA